MADGPVNQRASQRAIASHLTPARFFGMVGRLRSRTDIPIGLLLYANTIHHAGYYTFCRRAAAAGIDSILVADLPPEEAGPWLEALDKNGLCSVFIVSELTSKERIRYICANTTGFVYVVSRLGTTGEQQDLSANLAPTLKRLRRQTSLPLCVGFGLSRPEHISAVKKSGADGAIVGSALVRQIESHLNNPERMLSTIRRQVRNYKKATRG
jgi:tryptophan synthase alpha chain